MRVLRALQALRITVSREQVQWCYRRLLGREPESEEAIVAHGRFLTFGALVRHIASSPEYAGLRTSTAPARDAREPLLTRVTAAAYRDAIDQFHAARPVPPTAGETEYVEMHFQRTLDTLNLVHRYLPQGGSLADYSAMPYFRHALGRLLPGIEHVAVSGVNFELDDYAGRFGIGRFDLCLNTEVLEHLLYNPSHMAFSINRMLRPGGHLVLSTPNACSLANALRLLEGAPPSLWNQLNATSRQYYDRHNRDWTPFEVERLLGEHGFEVLDTFTRDYYESTRTIIAKQPARAQLIARQSLHPHLGDTTFVLARKVAESSAPVRSAWLYVLPKR
jgi:SAM-dependent methyltransferase